MVDIYDVIATLCGFLQRVNLFIWERKEKVIKPLSIMKDMFGDLRSATIDPKHWPTVHIYWPLLVMSSLKIYRLLKTRIGKIIP